MIKVLARNVHFSVICKNIVQISQIHSSHEEGDKVAEVKVGRKSIFNFKTVALTGLMLTLLLSALSHYLFIFQYVNVFEWL